MIPQSLRTCPYVGHQEHFTTIICICERCYNNRWVCTKCLMDGLHDHKDYLLESIQFQSFTEQKLKHKIDFIKQQNESIHLMIKQLYQIADKIKITIYELEQDLQEMEKQNKIMEIKEIRNLVLTDFCRMDDDQIKLVINSKIIGGKYENSDELLETIVNLCKNVQQGLRELVKQDSQVIKQQQANQFPQIQLASSIQGINSQIK